MSEWWTYTLSDFLLFSPRVYYRLFELHNRALWPAQLVTSVLGLAILAMLLRPMHGRERFIPAALGALWLWIAWAFFFERYATINWASVYVAPVFAAQGLLLIGWGAVGRQLAFALPPENLDFVGLALLTLSLAAYPFLAPLMGRPLSAAEVFGIAPDPTAIATLAVLAVARGVRWPLMVIPAFWCAVSAVTLWAMESGDAFVPIVGALAAIAVALSRRRSRPADRSK